MRTGDTGGIFPDRKIGEECGVFGLYALRPVRAAEMIYYGLCALQHRGQESCGIVVNDDGVFFSHKDSGLVSEVFDASVLRDFPDASMAVGHVRYGTTGSGGRRNCQPIEVNHQKGSMALAHNGNLANASELRDGLEKGGAIFHTTSDTEIIAYLVTQERLRAGSIEEAVCRTVPELSGAFSLIFISPRKMICVRDPHGFRPLSIGVTSDGVYAASSETCALRAVGAKWIRDVEPGEILVFSSEGVRSIRDHCGKKKTLCAFEYIYFARPDSVIDRVPVSAARNRAGRILAKEYPAAADLVVGVPDSGLEAALGYSQESGIPYGIGFVKNKYVGRTFIEPEGRGDRVRVKLSVVEEAVKGKRIVLIDDSIVRGTTSRRIIALLREAGAKEIHMRISSPPFLHPCYYGTDIDSEGVLIADRHKVGEIASLIGADSLGYLPVSALEEMTGSTALCRACFDGRYPTPVPKGAGKNRFETRLSEKSGICN